MKIYDTQKDQYGLPTDASSYLKDRGLSCSGTKFDLWIEMKIWNLVARIINFINP